MANFGSKTPITAEKLENMIRKYKDLTSDIDIEKIVTPTNLNSEKKRWISAAKSGIFNNPNFTYNERLLRDVMERKSDLEEIKKALMGDAMGLSSEDRTIVDLLMNRVEDSLRTIKFAEAISHCDDVTSAKISKEKFGEPSKQLVSNANEFANSMKQKDQSSSTRSLKSGEALFSKEGAAKLQDLKLDSRDVVKALNRALRSGEYRDWSVAIGPQPMPKIIGKEIVIPETFHITPFRLAVYTSRVIDCWILRESNAKQCLRGIGVSALKTDDDALNEGLEIFFSFDLELRALGKTVKMPSPFVTLAINQALRGRSFRMVGEEMFQLRYETGLKNPEDAAKAAWMFTYKAFRGITNMTNPGAYAFCKDKAQFEGYHMVKEIMARKDRRAKEWLFLGFYDRNDIEYLCQHNDLPEPIFRRHDLGIDVARSFL